MTENSMRVFNYLKEHYGEDLTAKAIAEDLGVSIAAVTGSVNGLVKKDRAVRTEHITEVDGKEVTVKYISLTEEGLAFDPSAED